MKHPNTSIIINTSVPTMLKVGEESGKPIIYGGNGSGPAFIESTANINQAVKDIVTSKSFDYGIASAAEQSVVVDSCIEPAVRKAFV